MVEFVVVWVLGLGSAEVEWLVALHADLPVSEVALAPAVVAILVGYTHFEVIRQLAPVQNSSGNINPNHIIFSIYKSNIYFRRPTFSSLTRFSIIKSSILNYKKEFEDKYDFLFFNMIGVLFREGYLDNQ